jgi:transposase-like protein
MLSDRRDTRAAYRLLRKALRAVSDYPPSSITTDKPASYPKEIQRLQNEGLLSKYVEHRTSKYLNNIIEADHGALKRVIRPTRGFQQMKTASATLTGFEIMRMIRRGHCIQRKRQAQAKSVSSISSSVSQLERPVRRVRRAWSELLQQMG